MDRLTSLMAFVRVVDCGGFTAAGRRLDMSTNMISNHVQALEERLGVRLLNRTTRSVSPTEIGKTYYDRCTQILADLQQADDIAGGLQPTPRGTLRIYAATSVAPFVSAVVVEFMSRYPDVKIDLMTGEKTIDLIEEGYDISVQLAVHRNSHLIARNLGGWGHVLCCSRDYLEKHGNLHRLLDLSEHNCVRHALCPFEDEWHFTDRKGAATSVKVTGSFVSNSCEILRTAALKSIGICMAPGFLVRDDLEAGRLVRLLPKYRPVEFSLNAVYPRRQHLSAQVRAFADLLAQQITEEQKLIDPFF